LIILSLLYIYVSYLCAWLSDRKYKNIIFKYLNIYIIFQYNINIFGLNRNIYTKLKYMHILPGERKLGSIDLVASLHSSDSWYIVKCDQRALLPCLFCNPWLHTRSNRSQRLATRVFSSTSDKDSPPWPSATASDPIFSTNILFVLDLQSLLQKWWFYNYNS